MLGLYKQITVLSGPVLRLLLRKRLARGKEDGNRICERMGKPSLQRPEGALFWIHAASVGEAQSALIMVDALLNKFKDLHILVTSGTVTSASLMASRLPERAFHQFYPLDHPSWVEEFIDYWKPDAVFWMESELWPNMLGAIRQRNIPAVLLNGHLSPASFRKWKLIGKSICELLATFESCLVQTETDASYFSALGARNVTVTDNLKYSARPLPCNQEELEKLKESTEDRPFWLYASTHGGEEELACRIHKKLKSDFPGLLTIIIPRHPERGAGIEELCSKSGLDTARRSTGFRLPRPENDIYIADTLGETGLFFRLVQIACIGRSFSDDGGGGHNPIEAAQLDCAVLHGPNVQNLAEIYREMNDAGACISLANEKEFISELRRLLQEADYREQMRKNATRFASEKASVIDKVMDHIAPLLEKLREKE
jgi:3-deoxy-D-manno-octulosonic-acid transferase